MLLKVTNPFDQSVACERAYADDAAVEKTLARARAAFAIWRETPLGERIATVARGVDAFRQHKETVARDVSAQMGKPIVQARKEVDTLIDRAEQSMRMAPAALASDVLEERDGFVRRIDHTPLGVVFDLAAWNYPLLIPTNVIVPALLAGNVVVLKHSAKTPLCGAWFARAFGELSPPGLVQDLVLTHAQTEKLLRDPRVDHVAFTGSVEGGRHVYQVASARFVEVGLELGGKDPAYVAADADLDFAVANVVDGACYNAGQSCCAVERVYVHDDVYDAFVEKSRAAIEAYVLGDPMLETTTMGPLASRSALAFLEGQVREASARGARVLTGGAARAGSTGNFFLPTLLVDVDNAARVMQEESFGPLLPILRVASDEQALAHMRDTAYGLTASVWTRDQQRAEWLARQLDVGTVYQNRCDYLDPQQPWTGVRDSGKGSTLSRYGFYQLTRPKSIHFRVKT